MELDDFVVTVVRLV